MQDRAAYHREYYARNKADYVARTKANKAALRAAVNELKAAPCTDCGHTFPPECMDFDHIDASTKVADVGNLVGQGHTRAAMAEIAKCELVCACCHRIRTKRRQTEE